MKRAGEALSSSSKVAKHGRDEVLANLEPQLEELEKLHEILYQLEEACAKEQLAVQRKYDAEKAPYYAKRSKLLERIPGFWERALRHHPATAQTPETDFDILYHLKDIQLEDNLDDSGSYRLSLIFDDAAKDWMTPLVLVKHVVFQDGIETVPHCTQICWKPNMDPIRASQERGMISLFEWFSPSPPDGCVDFGDIVRRDLWHMPLAFHSDIVDENSE